MAGGEAQKYLQKAFKFFLQSANIPPIIRAVIYWATVVIGSLIHDKHRPPDTYFSNKRNFLNVVFVKYSLAWTLAALGPFVFLFSRQKHPGNVPYILKNVSRLVVYVFIWYIVTRVFDFIHEMTGVCEGSELFSTVDMCLADGLLWNGFDISGHCFLLSYSSLVIAEEIQVVRHAGTERRGGKLKNKVTQILINLFYIFCCLAMLLWEIMLVFTAIYFHTVETKVIGILVGILAWLTTYQFWFLTDYYFSPGLPADSSGSGSG